MRRAESDYEGDWETAVQRGWAMTLEEAIELACTEAASGQEPRAGVRHADD